MIRDNRVLLSLCFYVPRGSPYRDPGEDGFLPAFLGTGMIPFVVAAPFGIKWGGPVIVRGCASGGSLLLTSK